MASPRPNPNPSPKPTIVLVHGAWHKPTHYAELASALRGLGYDFHTPALPSMNGSRPLNADLETDTRHLHDYVERLAQAGRQIIVLMHSYGGQVGTNALASLTLSAATPRTQQQTLPGSGGDGGGGVIHLIYMCALALPEGKSMMGLIRDKGREHLVPLFMECADDGTVVKCDPAATIVGPGLPEEKVASYVADLAPWNAAILEQGITGPCAWRSSGVGVSYIHTLQDLTMPVDDQRDMVATMRAAGKEVQVFELDTGHCPHVTRLAELVDVVDEIISGL